jgi:hypothetical protein
MGLRHITEVTQPTHARRETAALRQASLLLPVWRAGFVLFPREEDPMKMTAEPCCQPTIALPALADSPGPSGLVQLASDGKLSGGPFRRAPSPVVTSRLDPTTVFV